jgi:hypothetical protein
MAKELFITDNQQALDQSDLFFPRAVLSRTELNKIKPEAFVDVVLDGSDVEILDQFTKAKKWYLPNGLDFNTNLDIMNKSFIGGRKAYETPAPQPHKAEDDYLTGVALSTLNNQTPDPNFEEYIDNEIPLDEQIAILQPLLEGKRIGAGSIAELTHQLVQLCRANDLFVRDTVTGLYKSVFARKPLIPEAQAMTMFETHFWDKLAIKTRGWALDKTSGEMMPTIKYHDIKPQELKLLWQNVGLYSTFNSRKEFYESIPEWDGVERIATFMKKYFNCDTNPNFFLLLMTSIVAKFSPRNDYCPYFFDIVAEQKGIGKSYLCKRLVNKKYVGFLKMSRNRGMSDFFVDAYDGNNAIIVDDECTWCGSGPDKISYDELKNLVTVSDDKFSRKGKQPEQHERSFIIIRTSNFVQQVFSTNERRQIIFECHLAEKECRIKDLPDEFFDQMLAEAKAYYIKNNGIYQLTDDDQIEVKETNLSNYNWETKENYAILDYVNAVRSDYDKYGVKLVAQKFAADKWGSHRKYTDWCEEHRKPSLPARSFWRAVSALAELPENKIAVLSTQKYDTADGGHARVFRVDPVGLTEEEKAIDELGDMPL